MNRKLKLHWYQQNEQQPLTSNHWTYKRHVGNPGQAYDMYSKVYILLKAKLIQHLTNINANNNLYNISYLHWQLSISACSRPLHWHSLLYRHNFQRHFPQHYKLLEMVQRLSNRYIILREKLWNWYYHHLFYTTLHRYVQDLIPLCIPT